MKQPKHFESGMGWGLDPDFIAHAANCEQCRQFDPKKPATASALCLEGAVLYKRDNTERGRAPVAERPSTFATKAQVKAAMRYKGDPS